MSTNNQLTKEEEIALKQAELVLEMTKSRGWDIFKDFLNKKINNSWLDPRSCKSKEELSYQYSIAWGSAKAAEEIIEWVESKVQEAEMLLKKQRGEVVNKFGIGRKLQVKNQL